MQAYGTDHEVLQTACQWLQQGHDVVLITVLKTWGSSPRPAGSLLIMRRDGVVAGSVSGGCVEEDLAQRYVNHQLSDCYPTRIDYGVNRDDATRFGLPCGGRLELLIEKLDNTDQIKTQLEQLLDAMQQQKLMARHVDLQTGQVSLETARAEHDFVYTNIYVRKIFGPQWNMLLIGAGHLSQYVSQMALMLGQVEGTELTTIMPDDAVQKYSQKPRSVVLALTHDPKLDDMALLDALQSPAFYVGAIGSQRNCDLRRQRLKELGVSAVQLHRLHAPVGLPIGSHTPPEIAVSILAEVTQQRNVNSLAQSEKQTVSMV
jgi:xanthine dehydrogenase accessory factor